MEMKVLLASCLLALFGTCMLVQAAPAPRPARGVKRVAAMEPRDVLAAERIRRAQYNPKRARATYKQRRQDGASPRPETCPYNGPQPDTSQCADTYTSDGCTTGYYQVDPTELQLEGGYTLQSGGHVNFQYIPLSEYQGFGSYRDPDPNWTILSGGLQFDPNNNQPGAEWIGRNYFDWSAGADLPAEGYCIVWVQVDNLNPHFGEGGQGPVCYCPRAARA